MGDDEYTAEDFTELRGHLGDDVDELVRWQLTGILAKKAPVARKPHPPVCQNCGGEWHGLPNNAGCSGSFIFDTPEGIL